MTVIFNAILYLCCLCTLLGPEQHWDPPGCDVCWYFGLQKQGSDQLFPMVSVLQYYCLWSITACEDNKETWKCEEQIIFHD